MRLLIATTTTTTSGTAVQIRSGGTDSNTRVMAFQVSCRKDNGTPVYFGHSSNLTTANSLELRPDAQTHFPESGMFTFPTVGGKQGGLTLAQFWMNSTSTTSILESVLVVDP